MFMARAVKKLTFEHVEMCFLTISTMKACSFGSSTLMSSKGGHNCQSTAPLDHLMISCFVQRKFVMALDHHRVSSTFLYATISLLGLGLECEPAHFLQGFHGS